MATEFLPTRELLDELEEASFDRPPAVVANAHITGVGVARALADSGVPVIALDRSGDGVAPGSDAVAHAGRVTYPLDDEAGFAADLERIVEAVGREVVAFACMDEWVHGLADTRPEGVRLPFAADAIGSVLDKQHLYELADDYEIPYPETYLLGAVSAAEAIEAVGGFPLVLKPARKRKFEEALGTNVVQVDTREEFDDTVQAAREADARVLVQEQVNVETGRDTSLASYVPPADGHSYDGAVPGDALGVVGNAAVRYPRGFGTSCLVETVDRPEIARRALRILDETGYHGISEAEFVYDADREEYVLLDINTRPWKWISLPVEAGANLPLAAYRDAVSPEEFDTVGAADGRSGADGPLAPNGEPTDARWVYLPDYLELCATTPAFRDVLSRDEWAALVSGAFEDDRGFTTGVYRPSDPMPAVDALESAFGLEYYCSC